MRKLAKTLMLVLLSALLLLSACDEMLQSADLPQEENEVHTGTVGKYGMMPIYGRDIQDGSYAVTVESSSSFFRIAEAWLLVSGDEMQAEITIPSMSYLYVYPGTAEEAEKAGEAAWIGFTEKDEQTVFTIPVPALNAGIPCAAFSKKKQIWYDRTLLFDAASLPTEALSFSLPDEKTVRDYGTEDSSVNAARQTNGQAPTPVSLSMPDGEYSIELNMTGGSGRASISSPALLIVREGKAYVRLLWSSSYYDYMIVGGSRYDNLSTDGGSSSFEIPITAMDEAVPVVADTTAMGEPQEIEYALTFYSESIGTKGQVPQEAAKKVLTVAVLIIVLGGVLNHFLKKKRAQ